MYVKPEKIINQLPRKMGENKRHAKANLNWLQKSVHPYFFIT